jgi:hypothetical protein
MKWIGQHIWDFISRFRSDVYLEGTETGTIASGGNLGLDSNNKVVKATGVSSASTVTVTDSNTTTGFPVVFHDESNALLDDTGTFTYNPGSKHLGIIGGTPSFTLTENTNDSNDAHLTFFNSRNLSNDGQDGDDLGTIAFNGNDDGTPTVTTFAQFKGEIEDASNTDEAGRMTLTVASEGVLRQALKATGNGTSGKVDVGLGYGIGSTTTIAGGLTVNGLTSTFTNATTSQVIVKNTGDNTAGGIFDLFNERGIGVDGDTAGQVRFYADDDGGNQTLVVKLEGKIAETADGSEKGDIDLSIKTASGTTIRNVIKGSSSASDVVDVELGFGATSTTTIAGDLDIDGDTLTSAGALNIDPSGDLYLKPTSNIYVGDSNGTAMSIVGAAHDNGDGGDLKIYGGLTTAGQTNKSGGDLELYGGIPTGSGSFGNIQFFGGNEGSTGTTLRSANITMLSQLQGNFTGAQSTDQYWYSEAGVDSNDWFRIKVKEHGSTTLETKDNDGTNASLQITADGTAELAGTTVTLDSAGAVTFERGSATVVVPNVGGTLQIVDPVKYLLPSDFIVNDASFIRGYLYAADDAGSNYGGTWQDAGLQSWAWYQIPSGFKVTHIHAYGNVTALTDASIYQLDPTDGTRGSALAAGIWGTTRELSTHITSANDAVALVVLDNNAATDIIYSVKLTLAEV